MRTLILILVGLVVVAVVFWLTPSARHVMAAWLFTIGWLVASLINLRTGLSHGYTLAQELPIHLVLFGVPVLAAWAWVWYTRSSSGA